MGGPPAGSVLGTTEEQWQVAFDSVFLAALRLTDAVVRHGTAADLAVAWVLSTSVKAPIPGLAASNGLRPGLAMLVKQLADELGPDGTRVVGLLPGRVETERVQHLDSLSDDPAAARARSEAVDPAAALRPAGGVRPGRRLRAVAGRVVPHRLGGRGRRRGAAQPVTGVRRALTDREDSRVYVRIRRRARETSWVRREFPVYPGNWHEEGGRGGRLRRWR